MLTKNLILQDHLSEFAQRQIVRAEAFNGRLAEILGRGVHFGVVVFQVAAAPAGQHGFHDVKVFSSKLSANDVIEYLLGVGIVFVEVLGFAYGNHLVHGNNDVSLKLLKSNQRFEKDRHILLNRI